LTHPVIPRSPGRQPIPSNQFSHLIHSSAFLRLVQLLLPLRHNPLYMFFLFFFRYHRLQYLRSSLKPNSLILQASRSASLVLWFLLSAHTIPISHPLIFSSPAFPLALSTILCRLSDYPSSISLSSDLRLCLPLPFHFTHFSSVALTTANPYPEYGLSLSFAPFSIFSFSLFPPCISSPPRPSGAMAEYRNAS